MKFSAKYWLYLAWATAFVGTVASLYYSEIRHYAPCVLCWYQRIALYPIVVILLIGLARQDKKSATYALPFALAGLVLAAYHSLLQIGIVPEAIVPCAFGVSCATRHVVVWGLTIPMFSLLAFCIISFSLWYYLKLEKGRR